MSGTPYDETAVDTKGPDNRGDGAWKAPERYEVREVLGRGGMGEVTLAFDTQIGRGVAIKRMRGGEPSETAVTRFLREARVQARLDHPAIVPVHEIGRDESGQPFFTMKRLVGKTLFAALSDPAMARQQLLRVVIDVARAIDLAHTRGVIHRDLKPANIMLGDFGEVYVLDWGVARVIGESPAPTKNEIATLDDGTQTGALLGTPGYMAPEQVRGEDISPATDIYAIGAILFEVLAGKPLHPGGTAAIASTLTTPTAAPASRAPDRNIPPELDALCVSALAEDAAKRPTARQLADAIQRYLDGDRDLEARRSISARLLGEAHDALAAGDRAKAMQAAGRAMALDPESDAAAFVTKLILEPPHAVPADVESRVADREVEINLVGARQGGRSVMVMFAILPLMIWNGIASWPTVFALVVCMALATLHAYVSQRQRRFRLHLAFALLIPTAIVLCRFAGPFMIMPPIITIFAMALMLQHSVNSRPILSIGALLVCVIAPVALERFGVLDASWSIDGDRMVSRSTALEVSDRSTVLLVVANACFVVLAAMFARGVARTLREANRRLELQAWHLRQLLPTSSDPARA
jgi:eukaryotic-like serine/threonine-protein kinase